MRISDWSSDVCSSDLGAVRVPSCQGRHRRCRCLGSARSHRRRSLQSLLQTLDALAHQVDFLLRGGNPALGLLLESMNHPNVVIQLEGVDHPEGVSPFLDRPFPYRSEEHTSELQPLMRISYA